VVLTRHATLAFVLTTLLISGAAIGLVLARAWAAALLPWLAVALALLLAYSRRAALIGLFARLLHRYARGTALNYGLVVMVAAWLAYLATRASFVYKLPGLQTFRDSFPDSLLYGLLGMGLLLLIVVRGRAGLPWISNTLVRLFGSRRGATTLLALALLIWVGYQAYVVAGLPYVGHADYADNAVVARNLVNGRGWVVARDMAAAAAGVDRAVLCTVRPDRLGGQDPEPAVYGRSSAADLRRWRANLGSARRADGGADHSDQLFVLPAGDLHHQRPSIYRVFVRGDLSALPGDER
jgi:hypothetical protein